jgi:hypothetical protein
MAAKAICVLMLLLYLLSICRHDTAFSIHRPAYYVCLLKRWAANTSVVQNHPPPLGSIRMA